MENNNKIKVGVFGSCLSNLTALQLCKEYNYSRVFNVAHNRSDAFIGNFIEKSWKQLPISTMLSKLEIKKDNVIQATQIVNNQYKYRIGSHEIPEAKSIFDFGPEDVDVIFLDNFMDIAALLVHFKNDLSIAPFFINRNFIDISDDEIEYGQFLTAEQSVNNWLIIIDFLQERFPLARIIFLAFHYSTLCERPSHYERARTFNYLMNEKILEKDVMFIPSLSITPSLTKGLNDWAHFDDSIYKGIAGLLHLSINSTVEVSLDKSFRKNSDFNSYNEELKSKV